MNTTILFYWPTGGNVENAAKMIAKEYGELKLMSLSEINADTFLQNKNFIVGGSTLGSETWQGTSSENPWNSFFKLLSTLDLTNKKIALFGLGDQVLWPSNFVDGMGVIYNAFKNAHAKIVGKWPTEGYDFSDSKAEENGFFVGLALDEDQQAELSEQRIHIWVNQLKKEF
jgi:flavodoxin I